MNSLPRHVNLPYNRHESSEEYSYARQEEKEDDGCQRPRIQQGCKGHQEHTGDKTENSGIQDQQGLIYQVVTVQQPRQLGLNLLEALSGVSIRRRRGSGQISFSQTA